MEKFIKPRSWAYVVRFQVLALVVVGIAVWMWHSPFIIVGRQAVMNHLRGLKRPIAVRLTRYPAVTAIAIDNETWDDLEIERVVVNGEHELTHKANILGLKHDRIARPIAIKPNKSEFWFVSGTYRAPVRLSKGFVQSNQLDKAPPVGEKPNEEKPASEMDEPKPYSKTITFVDVFINGKPIRVVVKSDELPPAPNRRH